jgi:hypothetical protein
VAFICLGSSTLLSFGLKDSNLDSGTYKRLIGEYCESTISLLAVSFIILLLRFSVAIGT